MMTRMYANRFNIPKDNCLNTGIWIYFYFDFWEFIFYFHFLWKKKFREIAPKFSKNAGMLYKSLRRGKLLVRGFQRYMYGGIFTVNGFTSVCSSKSTRSLIICTIYIIANKNIPKTDVSNDLSGVKNITHETRQLLKWPARNPLSLELKEKKNEYFCFTCRTSFRLKYLLQA